MKTYWFTAACLVLAFACGGSPETDSQTGNEDKPKPADGTGNVVTTNSEDLRKFGEGLKITLENEEGERRSFPAELTITEKDRYVMYPWKEEAQMSWEGLNLVTDNLASAAIPNEVVTLVEYWSTDSASRSQYWSKFRELEQQYADSDELKLISINYDMVANGTDQITAAKNFLSSYSKPANLIYDLDDGFRDRLPYLPGPVSYILIDHRGQITHLARGDASLGAEVFDAIENALTYQDAIRNGDNQMNFEFNTDEEAEN